MIRRISAVMLAAPLAMGLPVFMAAPASADESKISSPANGTVLTKGDRVAVRAYTSELLTPVRLFAKLPDGTDKHLADRGVRGDIEATLEIPRNGRYTLSLKTSLLGRTLATSTFNARVPPSPPLGVTAVHSGSSLKVSWKRGGEADLTGYTVGAAGSGSKSGSVGTLCSGSDCTMTLPSKARSGSVQVNVRAQRSNGAGGSVASLTSTAHVPVGGGSGGGGGGTPGGSVPGGTLPPSLAGGMPPTGTTPLSPLNNQSPLTLPSVQPDGATPPYPAPQVAAGPYAPQAQSLPMSDELQWARSIGIALVLLVVAAHLGRWTRHLRVTQAGVSSMGMAARTARGGTGRDRVSHLRDSIAEAEAVAKSGGLPPELAKQVKKSAKEMKKAEKAAAKAEKSGAGTGARGQTEVLAVHTGDTVVLPSGAAKLGGRAEQDAREKPDADSSATRSLSGPDGAALAAAKTRTKRRPAKLGKPGGGVNVRIAKPADMPTAAQPKSKRRRREP